jgi:hypothetical protein
MDRQTLISKFEELKEYDGEYLHTIWSHSLDLVKQVKSYISYDLHEKLKVELDCVYYESIYGGDKEDGQMVRDDFIRVVDSVIVQLS